MEEKKTTQPSAPKSPGLAAILAFIPGVGAIYNGQFFKALIYILIFGGLIQMQGKSGVQPIAAFLLTGFYIYMVFEAYHTAKKINKKVVYGEVEEEIEEFEESKGSIFWGSFLVLLGIVFLLGNYDIISYSTLFNYWPVLIIIIGVKLVLEYFPRKRG
ncbi:DUF5668 domain-containing protein [SCandidatus Aminicenantes bacterium Aminicenantia_JdfR_composite]|jgi:hypothetical protein|nr:DUF5668 domain-containing protein [SCandidatus Aminicenantes bacterium Aminicenantia_JdfR_composite]MCP2598632.1 DUF5668 domain-containing protein [Candidatus Aminicenantes bacterium AC-335-L06]